MSLNRTKEQKVLAYQNRIAILKSRGDKNEKCPGIVRKLNRKLVKLQAELGM